MQINFSAPINLTSYGYCGINVLLELVKQGHDVSLFPLPNPQSVQVDNNDYLKTVVECYNNQIKYKVDAPSIRLWHQFDLFHHIGQGPHIGYTIFELNKFTDIERYQMNQLDTMCVPSQWAKKVMEEDGIKRPSIKVVPLGVNREIFKPTTDNPKDDVVRFLNVGKWEIRKGHDVLLDAFSRAFDTSDKVELYMCCHNQFIGDSGNKEWESYYRNGKLLSKIHILPRVSTQNDIAKLMNFVDVGVFPARAEGFNLEGLEMMSCGKHIIITNVTGHTEYANASNAALIECNSTEVAYDDSFFKNNPDNAKGEWAELGEDQIEQLVYQLRRLYNMKKEGLLRPNENGIETAERFSWQRTVETLIQSV